MLLHYRPIQDEVRVTRDEVPVIQDEVPVIQGEVLETFEDQLLPCRIRQNGNELKIRAKAPSELELSVGIFDVLNQERLGSWD